LHCGPQGAGHLVKMVHNGIDYRLTAAYAEGCNILRQAYVGKGHGLDIGSVDTETTPPREAKLHRYEMNLLEIAELLPSGSVIDSWLPELTAAAMAADPAPVGFEGWGVTLRKSGPTTNRMAGGEELKAA
jgi:6-phosphogluconate dehydrogenase